MAGLNKVIIISVISAVIQAATPPTSQVKGLEKDKILSTRRQLECMEEVRLDPDLVVKVKQGEWADNSNLLKQWVLCVMMKAGLMTREGVYRLDVAMAKTPQEHQTHVEGIIDKCLSKKAIPAHNIAFNFAKCFNYWSNGNFSYATIF